MDYRTEDALMDKVEEIRKSMAQLNQDRLDAQRYRKLREFHKSTDRAKWDDLWNSYSVLDSAVDALPEGGKQ